MPYNCYKMLIIICLTLLLEHDGPWNFSFLIRNIFGFGLKWQNRIDNNPKSDFDFGLSIKSNPPNCIAIELSNSAIPWPRSISCWATLKCNWKIKYSQTCVQRPPSPRDPKIVAVIGRWSLFRGDICYKSSKWDHKMVVVVDKWSLLGG